MANLKLQHICKTYKKDRTAVKDFNLDIQDREFIVLVGPSGCGKSTILRLIAGLEDVTEGKIIMDGKLINNVPPKDRDIAFVFQNYALYPHMNVYQNLAFGLKSRKFSRVEIDRRVKDIARLTNLEEHLDRKPKFLSGGQQQRVALGRAMVRDARIFLMDEPLSNLDAKLRAQMRTEITKLHQSLQRTILYVTHDQTEAMTMATRLVVMNNGEIQQIGTPKDVYERPENVFVAGFIGSPAMNFLTGTLLDGKIHLGHTFIDIPEITIKKLYEQDYANRKIIIGIRPEDLHVATELTQSTTLSIIKSKVEVIELLGSENIVHTHIASQPLTVRLNTKSDLKQGQFLKLALDMTRVHFFDYKTEKRIPLNGI